MSALANLQQHLDRFWALPHHEDAALNEKLNEVQSWQQARIKRTHSTLFEQPKNQLMAGYFLTQLYGGDEFKVLAEQLGRILPKAKKLERLAKESSLEAGSMGIQASILAIELDLHLAQWLLEQELAVNEENMLLAYRTVDEANGTAYRYNFQPLYDFIDSGFKAMKPLKSVSSFIEPFCARELEVIDEVHAMDNDGKPAAFAV